MAEKKDKRTYRDPIDVLNQLSGDWEAIDAEPETTDREKWAEKKEIVETIANKYYGGTLPGVLSDWMIDYEGGYDKDGKHKATYNLGVVREVKNEPLELKGRAYVKNFGDDPQKSLDFLKMMNPEVEDLRMRNGKVIGRRKGENYERVMDPGFGWHGFGEIGRDMLDVFHDAADAAGTTLGSMFGGPIGSALMGSAMEDIRQGTAKQHGLRDEYDYGKTAWAGVASAAPDVAMGGIAKGKDLLSKQFMQEYGPRLGRGFGGLVGGWYGDIPGLLVGQEVGQYGMEKMTKMVNPEKMTSKQQLESLFKPQTPWEKIKRKGKPYIGPTYQFGRSVIQDDAGEAPENKTLYPKGYMPFILERE